MSDGTEARVRIVAAAFGDGERGRVWRERLGADYKLAAELLIDGVAQLGVDFDEIDGERVREVVAVHLPARLSGAESFAADVPDLLEDFLDFVADEVGLARKWEWLTAVGEAREAFAAALDDPGRPRVAPPRQEPVRRPGAKLGRNDPCPCGSGKKYKHCCLDR